MRCFVKATLGLVLSTMVILSVNSNGICGDKTRWCLSEPTVSRYINPRFAEYTLWQLRNPTTPMSLEDWLTPPISMPKPMEPTPAPLVPTPVETIVSDPIPTWNPPVTATATYFRGSDGRLYKCANGRCPNQR